MTRINADVSTGIARARARNSSAKAAIKESSRLVDVCALELPSVCEDVGRARAAHARMGDRAVYCARLESVCTERYRGFESPPIRHLYSATATLENLNFLAQLRDAAF